MMDMWQKCMASGTFRCKLYDTAQDHSVIANNDFEFETSTPPQLKETIQTNIPAGARVFTES